MNDNIVKLVFQTVMAGSGFAKMNAQTSELMKKMGKMSQGVQIMGRAFGDLGGIVGRSVGMLMQGGIWGAAAEIASGAVSKAVSVYREWKQTAEDARYAALGLTREVMTLEKIHAGYLKRVESYRKRQEEADRAEKEAMEKKRKAAEAYLETQRKNEDFAIAYAEAQERIVQEQMKAGLQSDKEIDRLKAKVRLMLEVAKANVASAEKNVYTKARRGDEQGMMLAQKDLELTKVQQKNVVAEAKKMVAEYRKAKEIAEEETEARMEEMRQEDFIREENEKKSQKAEKAAGEIRRNYAEAVKRIEDEIARKKKDASEWDARAQRAQEVGFGDWSKGERDLGREQRANDRQKEIRDRAVDAELKRLEKTNPRTRTDWQKDRISKLKEWKSYQDPSGNKAANDVQTLESKREELLKEQNAKLDKIASLLEGAVTL